MRIRLPRLISGGYFIGRKIERSMQELNEDIAKNKQPIITAEILPWDISKTTNSDEQYLSIFFRPELQEPSIMNELGEVVRFHRSESIISFNHLGNNLSEKIQVADANNYRSDIGLDVSYRTRGFPSIRIYEYEREKLPERVGSGQTAFKMEMFFTKDSFKFLRESIDDQNFPRQQDSKPSHHPLLLIQVPCKEIPIPYGRKIVPDSQIEDRFEWCNNFTHIRCLLFGVIVNDKYPSPFDLLSNMEAKFDRLKSWQVNFST